MTTTDAYQTILQEVYWGDDDKATSADEQVSTAGIPSQLTPVSRPVLGRTHPQIVIARVDYRLALQDLEAGEFADALRATPDARYACIQTDAGTAMAGDGTISGVPRNAAQAGLIIGGVTVQPRGPVYRCAAHKIDDVANQAVTPGNRVFMVATKAGRVSRGGTNFDVKAAGAILDLGTDGISVVFPGTMTGWVLDGKIARPGG